MAKATKEQTVKVILELDEEEAKIVEQALQSAVGTGTFFGICRRVSRAITDALQG